MDTSSQPAVCLKLHETQGMIIAFLQKGNVALYSDETFLDILECGYKVVDGKCFKFDTVSFHLNYEQAVIYCTIMGGRLFEPRSEATNQAVFDAFLATSGVSTWLGIRRDTTDPTK